MGECGFAKICRLAGRIGGGEARRHGVPREKGDRSCKYRLKRMILKDLLQRNRSYRRFYQEVRLEEEELREWVGLTRWCASARNAQPLKYALVCSEAECARVFPHLAWAGYLADWAGPEEGERPAAYLIQLLDTRIAANCLCDDGLQIQAIMLAAVEKGYGGCIVKAFKDKALREVLQLPEELKINYVLALGKPKEQVVTEPMQGEHFRYWRDAAGIHHVPKRGTDTLIYRLPEQN